MLGKLLPAREGVDAYERLLKPEEVEDIDPGRD